MSLPTLYFWKYAQNKNRKPQSRNFLIGSHSAVPQRTCHILLHASEYVWGLLLIPILEYTAYAPWDCPGGELNQQDSESHLK